MVEMDDMDGMDRMDKGTHGAHGMGKGMKSGRGPGFDGARLEPGDPRGRERGAVVAVCDIDGPRRVVSARVMAGELGFSLEGFRQFVVREGVPHLLVGRVRRFDRAEVMAFCRERAHVKSVGQAPA
jgi:hypothetical protein